MDKLIKAQRAVVAALLDKRGLHEAEIATVRSALAERGDDATATADEEKALQAARGAIDGVDTEIRAAQERLEDLEKEKRADDAAAQLRSQLAGVPDTARARVTNEERTYHRGNDPKGHTFLRDVGAALLGNDEAIERIAAHRREERVERAGQVYRAAGTGNFSGLTVPQYLTEMYAKRPQAGRPFADAINRHDLPEQGMTVELSRITTGTTVDRQANQGDAVATSDIDDTILSIPVRTNAGGLPVSRQAVERSGNAEQVTIEDLLGTYDSKLDSHLINDATTGLIASAAASGVAVTYTDASPTAAELYPKLLDAKGQIETALLSIARGDIAVMTPLRWAWLQSQLSSTWPTFGQPGIMPQLAGQNFAERYGAGLRGLLPDDTAVIVDANIPTNLGAGTNEDRIIVAASQECHLWEDPNAPMLIKAEQSKVNNLLIDYVVYGYFAYTYGRYPKAVATISGTGLVTPTF